VRWDLKVTGDVLVQSLTLRAEKSSPSREKRFHHLRLLAACDNIIDSFKATFERVCFIVIFGVYLYLFFCFCFLLTF